MNEKCFCDLYRSCVAQPESEVNIGFNVVKQQADIITGPEFVADADKYCPGTKVFVDTSKLAGRVVVGESDVVLSRESVLLQCEYFVSKYPTM